ncbi:MAG TPA: M42 family metallopeptidase [Candidatus Ozemobacteraceae bacterium]|nr:M42 family metallopeptidase [Candidatus Ozemobacteraceae bacterium]
MGRKSGGENRMVSVLRELQKVQGPSGFTDEAIAHVAEIARKAGIRAERTLKGGLLVGQHPQPRFLVAGHLDTLGAMVCQINGDGTLAITKIGGPLLPSFEGEYVTVHTMSGKLFRGTLLLNNPAAHVNRDAEKAERKPENMHIRLDAVVSSKKDVRDLGIEIGDFICFDTRFEYVDTGFIKSRFLDDRAGCAVMIDTFLTLGRETLEQLPVAFFFSNYEEVGHGACAGFPESIEEMLVVDMGVVGDRVDGDELSVSICPKDSSGPYDYQMRCELVSLAKEGKIPHKIDVFPYYGSDGSAALRAGRNIRVGLIGPGVSASHGMERTHEKGLVATRDLVLAWLEARQESPQPRRKKR